MAPSFDNEQAFQEGWSINESFGSSNGPYQIQQVDDPEAHDPPLPAHPFDGDEEAWAHVVKQAVGGSAYHQSALAFVREHNPMEWDAIRQAHPEVMPRVRVPAARRPTTRPSPTHTGSWRGTA